MKFCQNFAGCHASFGYFPGDTLGCIMPCLFFMAGHAIPGTNYLFYQGRTFSLFLKRHNLVCSSTSWPGHYWLNDFTLFGIWKNYCYSQTFVRFLSFPAVLKYDVIFLLYKVYLYLLRRLFVNHELLYLPTLHVYIFRIQLLWRGTRQLKGNWVLLSFFWAALMLRVYIYLIEFPLLQNLRIINNRHSTS